MNHDTCIGCKNCEPRCPQHCITYREDGKCVVDQELCLGCGFCKIDCPSGALSIRQTMPAREKLNDYYFAENRIDDLCEHAPARHYDGIEPVGQ